MSYQYGYEDIDLFVEQGTERVPDDRQYHIVLRGRVIEHEGNLTRALGRLQQLRNNLPTDEQIDDGTLAQNKLRSGEMAARYLQQSTAEKTATYGRKGKKA